MVQINIFSPLMDRYGTVSIDLYSIAIGHLYVYLNLQIGSSFLVRRIYS